MKHLSPFFLLLLLSVFSYAQPQAEKHADVEISLSKESGFQIGDVIEVRCTVKPFEGWYACSSIETGAYMPASFDLGEKAKHVETVGQMTEEGEMHTKYDEIMEGDINTYDEKVIFIQKVKITGKNPRLTGSFSYQACFENKCIFPNWDFEYAFKARKAKK